MYDVWDVIGLNGTGADSYSVDNLFVPEKFAALRDEALGVAQKGPLYRLPTYFTFSLGFGAVSLGVARATLDAASGTGARQGLVRHQADARQQRGAGGDRPRRGEFARGARLSLCDRGVGLWRDLPCGEG